MYLYQHQTEKFCEILMISLRFSSVVRQEGRSSSDRKAFFSGLKKGVWEIVWYREIPCSTKRRCKKRCWRQALSFLSDNPRHHHYKEKEDARDCSNKSRNIFVKNIFNNRVHMFTFFVDQMFYAVLANMASFGKFSCPLDHLDGRCSE